MKYFILAAEEKNPLPVIKNWFEVLSPADNRERFYEIPDWNILNADINENTLEADILSYPCILLTEKVLRVFELYCGTLSSKHVVLIDRQSQIFYTYCLVRLPVYKLLREDSILDRGKSELVKGRLDAKRMGHISIFLIGEISKPALIIREDVAESLIRRNVRGIRLQELDLV